MTRLAKTILTTILAALFLLLQTPLASATPNLGEGPDFSAGALSVPELSFSATPVPSCYECKGGVVRLVLRYDGSSTADIQVKDDKKNYFFQDLEPGQTIELIGTDKDNKFNKNELVFFVNGAEVTKIHVSCSKPINPGLSFGPFTIVVAESKDNGAVCPVGGGGGCTECDGGIRFMELRYDGASSTRIRVFDDEATYFDGTVAPGGTFSIANGGDKFEKNSLTFWTSGGEYDVHVSCSDDDVAPGYIFGPFTITDASSEDGAICPVIPPPGGCQECKDGVRFMELRYDGPTANVRVSDDDAVYFNQTVTSGSTFTVSNNGSKFEKNNLDFVVSGGGSYEVHVSCSDDDVAPGYIFGPFSIVDANSGDGPICPIIPPPGGCSECKGGVTDLTFENTGSTAINVRATDKDAKFTRFQGTLQPGQDFTVNDIKQDGLSLFVNGALVADDIHLSCSDDNIVPGYTIPGTTLEITGGVSKDNGEICPGDFPSRDIDLELEKSIDMGASDFGNGIVEYVVTLRNSDDAEVLATLTEVEERLPAGASVVSASAPSGSYYNQVTNIWSIPLLGVGDELELRLRVDITGISRDNTKNCVQVKSDNGDDIDSTPGNFSGSPSEDDEACADLPFIDLALVKDAIGYNSSTREATYRVTVTNEGPITGTGVVVRDYPPSDAFFVSGSGMPTQGTNTNPGGAGASIDWTIGTLTPGQTETFTFRLVIGSSLSTFNQAEIFAADQDDIDSIPGNLFGGAGKALMGEDDDDSADLPIVDLSLDKSIDSYDPVTKLAVYTLTVENNSFVDATDVVVRDAQAFDSVTEIGPAISLVDGQFNVFDWDVGTVAAGTSETISVSVTIGNSRDADNCAEVNSMDPDLIDFDSVPGNFDEDASEDDEKCIDVPLIDLELTKTVDMEEAWVGENVVFTIDVVNQGPDPATGVTLRDLLPAGLQFVSAQGAMFNQSTLTWTIGDLAVGEGRTVELTAEVLSVGTFVNYAEVSAANEYDWDSTPSNLSGSPSEDDEDEASVIARPPVIDLSLIKVVDRTVAEIDDLVTYTLTLTNESDKNAATEIDVVDYLPAGLDFVSATAFGATFNESTLLWEIGSLAPGASRTLTLKARATMAGTWKNCAEVLAADQADSDSSPANFDGSPSEDDEACARIVIKEPKIDLELTKTVDLENAWVGEDVVFTVRVINQGPADATGVVLRDYLPSELAFVSATGPFNMSTLSWNVGNLAVGQMRSYTLTATVLEAGTFKNFAEVVAADQMDVDSTPDNFGGTPQEDDEDKARVIAKDPIVDLELEKTVAEDNLKIGDQVVYTLKVRNTSDKTTATDIKIVDYLPAGLDFVDATAYGASFDDASLLWKIASLAPGDARTLTLKALTTEEGEFRNCAEIVAASPYDSDSTPGNFESGEDDEACVDIWVADPWTDLELEKTVSDDNVDVGDEIVYTLKISNTSTVDATGVKVADYLPGGLTIVGSQASTGYFSTSSKLWTVGTLPAGDMATLELWVEVKEAGEHVNCAEVTHASPQDKDSTPGNFDPEGGVDEDDEDCVSIWTTNPKIDLELEKSVDVSSARVGETVTWTLELSNVSDKDATGIEVIDYLPGSLKIESASTDNGWFDASTGTWELSRLMAGDTAILTIETLVKAGGEIKNCAEVAQASPADRDSTPGNFKSGEDDEDCAQIWVDTPETDLELDKDVDQTSAEVGDVLIYTITLSNTSDTDATDIKVVDYLPSQLDVTYAQASSGWFNKSTGVWELSGLAAGESAILTFKATIDGEGEIKNCAEVAQASPQDKDSTPGNHAAKPREDDSDCVQTWVNDPKTDLELDKDVDQTSAEVGDVLIYTITLSNTSDTDATDIKVVDYLPSQLDVTYAQASSGWFNKSTGVWELSGLAAGESAILTFKATIDGEGEIKNCAEVAQASPQDKDSTPGNHAAKPREDDSDCVQTWVNDPKTDLELLKTVSEDNVMVGDEVVYTLTLSNESGTDATGVKVADYLPGELEITGSQASTGWFSTGSNIWTVGTLPAGETVTLDLWVVVKEAGEHVNCAEVTQASPQDKDSTPGNHSAKPREDDSACVSIWTGQPKTDLELIKTVSEDNVKVGDEIVYTLTLTNDSDTDATNIEVQDYLPSALSITGSSASTGWFNSSSKTWEVASLPKYQAATLQLWVRVDEAGEHTNCAEIKKASPADKDSTPGNYHQSNGPKEDDESCVSIWTEDPTIDLQLTKSVDKTNVKVGDTVTYTLELSNQSGIEANGVKVEEYLPNGVSFEWASADLGSFSGSTWYVGTLPEWGSATLELAVVVQSEGEHTNCAEVKDASPDDKDSTPGNLNRNKGPKEDDEGCVTIWADQAKTDLALDKTVASDIVMLNEVFTYSIVLTNESYVAAKNIIVQDYLPGDIQVVASRTSDGWFSSSTGAWELSRLDGGASARLEIDVKATKKGELLNCAEVSKADPADKDSRPGNYDRSDAPVEDDESCAIVWVREQGTNELTGYVYRDVNENQYFDAGDYGQGGVIVQLYKDLNNNDQVDSYDRFIEDKVTDADGFYGFWISTTGSFVVQTDASTLPAGSWLLGDNSEDADFAGFGETDPNNNFPFVIEKPSYDALCYLVADNDGLYAGSDDVLTKLATDASAEYVIGHTYTDHIESIAFHPWTGKLYGADDRRLGLLDINTGAFTEIGEFGGGEGDTGWRPFLDIDGLTFDPITGELFATVRKVGESDFLIKVDPNTGQFLPFPDGKDYQVIYSPFGLEDMDDIAIDPTDGTIFGVNNTDGENSRLVKIDRYTGRISDVKSLPIGNVEGLGFYGDGTMYGTGGEGQESILIIDKKTLNIEIVLSIGTDGNRDYEAIDCLTSTPNRVSVTIFNDFNRDGVMQFAEAGLPGVTVELYRDANGSGRVDAGDMLVDVRHSGGNGSAVFEASADGNFVTRITSSGLPLGSALTSSAEAQTRFSGFGRQAAHYIGVEGAMATDNEDLAELPEEFRLETAYPNPFNPQTTVPFTLTETGAARVAVYDMLGREVAILLDRTVPAGHHEVRWDAGSVPSGTYLVRLTAGARSATSTVTLVK